MTTADEARKSLEGVTPGPWRVDGVLWNQIVWSGADNRVCFLAHSNGLDDDRDVATARFIAWCREGVPALLADHAAKDAEIARLRADLTAVPSPDVAGRIYLDLDGVMADFDAHFPAVFGLDHRSMADDDMWCKINAHPSYFEDMPLCAGAAEFFAEIRHLRPIVLTACPRTNYAHVAGQKRRWVHRHLGQEVMVLPVMGGHNKRLFMHSPGDILIDDYEKNCAPWRKAGGLAITHTSFADTRAALARVKGGAA